MKNKLKSLTSIPHSLKITKWTLSLIFVIFFGAILRFINFQDNFYFGHDQARDLFRIYEMIHAPKLKLIGPETDIPGLFCGPLYYYLLGIFYFISNFNPNSGVLMHILINLSGIPLLYYFGKSIKNNRLGIVAAILWAVSFEQINYSHWLSNPAFLSIASIVFFLGIYQFFIENKQIGFPLSILGLGLGTQLDFYFIYLIIVYPIFFFFFPIKISKNSLKKSLIVAILIFSSFAVAEIKFKFLGISSFLGYVGHQNLTINIWGQLALYINSISKSLYYAFSLLNNFMTFMLFTVIIFIVCAKEKFSKNLLFLVIWLLSTLPLFGFSQTNIVSGNFIHGTIQPAITLWMGLGIFYLFDMKKNHYAWLLIIIIIGSNLSQFYKNNFSASIILAHQEWTYKDQKAVVDYTYRASGNKPFGICSVSNPLFINNHWSTLYFLNGKRNYGFMPFWLGPNSTSETFFETTNEHPEMRFLILDPSHQLSEFAYKATIYAEDQKSVIDEQRKFGEIIVQKRHVPKNSEDLVSSQKLTEAEIATIDHILKSDDRYRCN